MIKILINRKLTTKQFILAQTLILIVGLLFLSGLFFILNIQYQPPKNPYSLGLPVTTPPKSLRITLEQPDDNMLSFEPTILVSGKTSPNMEVLIITTSGDLVIKSKSDGSFSTIIKLEEGVNNIQAVVFDSVGDSRVEERTVFYSKEKL